MSTPQPEFRALVADPSSHMAGLVTLMLHSLKIRAVDEVLDLARAGQALSRKPYNVVLIDEKLSSTDDFELIRALRQSPDHPNRLVPIIMMAVAPDARMITSARDAGVTEFLRKPFSAQHIALRLEAIRNAPRPFVETEAYTGPDRRRRARGSAARRRATDKPEAQSA